jgi:hypothetical protein
MAKLTPYFERRHPWRERLIAIIAIINLLLVFFDLSYLENLETRFLDIVN